MNSKIDAAIKSIQALLTDPKWEHRSFEKLRERFKGVSEEELRKLLIAAGATTKKSRDGKELWSLEGKEMTGPTKSNRQETEIDSLKAEAKRQGRGKLVAAVFTGTTVILGFAGYGLWSFYQPEIKGYIQRVASEINTQTSLPTGAVVAFDRPCPTPVWVDYKDGAGKFILGAGLGTLKYDGPHIPLGYETSKEVKLTKVKAGHQGGEEKNTLTLKEMPRHNHKMLTNNPTPNSTYFTNLGNKNDKEAAYGRGDGHGYKIGGSHTHEIKYEGGGEDEKPVAHNNMPPYIALYFCKKN